MKGEIIQSVAFGALSGFVGTFALQAIRTASETWLPETLPPFREEPGVFMVEQAEEALPQKTQNQVPETAEAVSANMLAAGYGMTAGVLYGLACPKTINPAVDGTLLGLGVWAVGYLGWLPALDLTPPITQQEPKQAIAPALRHIGFGIVTAAVYHWLQDRWS